MNKVRFNLKNVHIAKLTTDEDGTITYGVPKKIPGAVEISLDPEGDSSPFNADGITYYLCNSNNGYSCELTIALIPDWFEEEYLSSILSDDGDLIEDAAKEPKPFAFLFQFDGDVKATRHILYNCLASRSKISGKTTSDKKEPDTDVMSMKAMPIECGEKNIVKGRTTDTSKNYAVWFDKAPTLPTFTAPVQEGA